jgi:hypothetical protein
MVVFDIAIITPLLSGEAVLPIIAMNPLASFTERQSFLSMGERMAVENLLTMQYGVVI